MRPSAGFRDSKKKKKEKKNTDIYTYSADVPNVLYARKCMDYRMQTCVGFPMMVFSADGMQNRGRYNVASTCVLRPTIVSPHTPRTYNHSFQIPNQQAPPLVFKGLRIREDDSGTVCAAFATCVHANKVRCISIVYSSLHPAAWMIVNLASPIGITIRQASKGLTPGAGLLKTLPFVWFGFPIELVTIYDSTIELGTWYLCVENYLLEQRLSREERRRRRSPRGPSVPSSGELRVCVNAVAALWMQLWLKVCPLHECSLRLPKCLEFSKMAGFPHVMMIPEESCLVFSGSARIDRY